MDNDSLYIATWFGDLETQGDDVGYINANNLKAVEIDGRQYDDCFVVDSVNARYDRNNDGHYIKEYAISKKEGLIYYKTKDNRVFTTRGSWKVRSYVVQPIPIL